MRQNNTTGKSPKTCRVLFAKIFKRRATKLQTSGETRREIAEVWAMIVAATPRMSERVARRFGCGASWSLFTAALLQRRFFRYFWRQVWQPAHTLGLKRVVARERAALFTDLPQMRVEHSWGQLAEYQSMRLSVLSTAVAARAGVLCCVLFMVISAQAFAQTSATDNPSPTAAQPSAPAQEKPAAAAEEKPPAADDKPATVEQKPAPAEEKPAIAQDKPAAVEEKSAATDDKPAIVEQKPAAADAKPAVVEQKPAPAEEKPAVAHEKPALKQKSVAKQSKSAVHSKG